MPEETTASFVARLDARPCQSELSTQPRGLVDCRQIRAGRALLGWTQRDLGIALGVNERQIRFWERRLPSSELKGRKIVVAFAAAGVEFVASPGVGVCWTGRGRI